MRTCADLCTLAAPNNTSPFKRGGEERTCYDIYILRNRGLLRVSFVTVGLLHSVLSKQRAFLDFPSELSSVLAG